MVNQPPAHEHPCTLHKNHPTSVAFFDEAGAISSDRFFVVGLLRVENHPNLLKGVKKIRKKRKYYEEFKWASITAANFSASQDLLDLLLDGDASFSCFVADRQLADPVVRFGDTFRAYEKLATQLLIGSIQHYELTTVIADNYSAPNYRSFENTVRKECNDRLERLAVASVIQVDSKATEGLQLVDMLTGAVAFGFKADAGLANHESQKGRMASHLRQKLGVVNFDTGFKSASFNVKLYEHGRWLRRQQLTLSRQASAV